MGAWEFRGKFDPGLRKVFESIGLHSVGKYAPVRNRADAAAVLDKIGKRIAEKAALFPEGERVVPAFFSTSEKDGLVDVWHLGAPEIQPGQNRKMVGFGQMHFSVWARLLAEEGILPVSGISSLHYHDMSHVLSMLRNPHEEIHLQRKFYKFYVRHLDPLDLESGPAFEFYRRYQAVANYFFEGCTFPKIENLQEFFSGTNLDAYSDFHLTGTKLVSAEALIRSDRLPKTLENELNRFETAYLSTPERFYSSMNGYGGDHVDFANHFRYGIENHTAIFGEAGDQVDLESLFMQYATLPEKRREARLRLFAAYYNAEKLGMTFDLAHLHATEGALAKDAHGLPIPWKDTATELYFRSYANPSFLRPFIEQN